jgi:hypothetical protein
MKTKIRLVSLILCALALYSYAQDKFNDPSDFPVLKGPYLGMGQPGDSPQLFAPGIVSTCHEHSSAMFTPDGKELWFGRLSPGQIYFMRQENGQWSPPQAAPFSGVYNDLYPTISYDGNTIFFSSDRPISNGDQRLPRSQYHLWMVKRTETGWTQPIHLDYTINFGTGQSCASICSNGTLYFNAKNITQSGKSMDIYRAKLIDGKFTQAENLGEIINNASPDHSPFIAPDESYIIFSSFRGGYGRSDLFISYHRDDGTWTQPINLGSKINSAAKDEYPYVSPDGKYLFFNSNRVSQLNAKRVADGPGNIYWVDAKIIAELKPADLTLKNDHQ